MYDAVVAILINEAKEPNQFMARQIPYKKQPKDNSKRNSIVAFCAAFFGYAALFGLNGIGDFLLGGGIAFLLSSVVKIMTAPMKGLAAPRTSDGIVPENIQDDHARNTIVKGLELLEELRRERDNIGEHVFTRRINEFAEGYSALLNLVVKDHDKATHLRKLNSYYIPTIIKLLQSYQEAKRQGTSYMEISETREDLLKTLSQLVEATRVLKKKLVKVNLESMDIKIEVLEDILRADGYIETEEARGMRESAAQAAAEMPLTQQMGGAAPAGQAMPRKTPVKKPAAPHAPARSAASAGPVPKARDSAPVIRANVPTASAQQMQQGAPILHVPGLLDDQDIPPADKHNTVS